MPKAKTKQTEPAPIVDPDLEIFGFDQGSEEWLQARMGVCTASNFATMMASGRDGGDSKTRAKLMRQMAGEVITGIAAETYRNAAMERGNSMEDEIRQRFTDRTMCEVTRIGFGKRKKKYGASPDSLLDHDGGLEIKSMNPAGMIELIEKGSPLPPEHRAQIQGNMFVFGRRWWKLVISYTGMPLLEWTLERDDAYIANMIRDVDIFELDLRRLVAKVKAIA